MGSNELSNFDLINIIKKFKLDYCFGGVYSKDQMPELKRDKFYINTRKMCSLEIFLEILFLGALLAFLCSFVREGKKNWNISFFEREGQELNNRMCSHNLDLETTKQTFMLHARPSPICPLHP
jgi:hypothetical protein